MAKSDGEKGKGLYENWLKNFTINIMTQSFHAFLLMFILKMLSEVNSVTTQTATHLETNDGILAVLSIVGMMGIIKFEKLIKQLFGIGESLSGSLQASGMEAFQGFKAASKLSGEITQPFKKSRESRKTMNKLGTNLGLTPNGENGTGTLGKYIKGIGNVAGAGGGAGAGAGGGPGGGPTTRAPLSNRTQELYDKMKDAKQNGDMDLYRAHRDHAVTQMKSEKIGAGGGPGGGAQTSGNNTGGTPKMTSQQQVEQYNDSVLENRQDSRKKWLNSAGTLAALSMGLGATDTTANALTIGNILNDPINAAGNRYIEHGENITANKSTGDSRYDEKTVSNAIKDGFTRATSNMRNGDGKLNPVKITVAAATSYVATPYNAARGVLKSSKVDNVDNI
ncbi:MAG: hypothetical protein PHD15_01195 [Clostridia bacterium]|nr:hypothetical protein [Clostridia bacterium]MDD4386365.1 hypothetical protein [Clostridia bacterium]